MGINSLSQYYYQMLVNTEDGKKILDWRSVSRETADIFQLGYSLHDDTDLVNHMSEKKEEFVKEKLFYKGNDGIHDTMRGRFIFPIQNEKGNIVAFGGRDITEKDQVKYLNTGETDQFKKSHVLFGLYQAKKSVEKRGYIILMEGYMDVIQSYQNNIRNVVSALGTNLSKEQAHLIKKHTTNVVIAFDNDGAGSEATIETARLLQEVGCNVLIAYMGANHEGKDPDDYIKELGGVSFQKNVIAKAYPVAEFFMKNLSNEYNFSYANERYDFTEKVLNFLKSSNDNKQYAKIMRILKERFNIPVEMLKENIQ